MKRLRNAVNKRGSIYSQWVVLWRAVLCVYLDLMNDFPKHWSMLALGSIEPQPYLLAMVAFLPHEG